MTAKENTPLAPLTTLGVGGPARFLVEAHNEKDVVDAVTFARLHNLPLFVLGKGSNILVPDEGISGVVVRMEIQDILVEDTSEGIRIKGGAGALWDDVVDEAGARGLFGIENLAGIPGSLGGAAVQNIGAYGTELSETFEYADVIHSETGERSRITNSKAQFAYRTSLFKEHPELIITHVSLMLSKEKGPHTAYADLAKKVAEGVSLATPSEVAVVVRGIRAKKIPPNTHGGTAGSFFKNPVVSQEAARALKERFPDLPLFPQENGTVKIQIAWILDHVLSLKGYAIGSARLYEEHPLIVVASAGATAAEVDALAQMVARRVHEVTGIVLEREVETFGYRPEHTQKIS